MSVDFFVRKANKKIVGFELYPEENDERSLEFCKNFPREYSENRAIITFYPDTDSVQLRNPSGPRNFVIKQRHILTLEELFKHRRRREFVFYKTEQGGFGIVLKDCKDKNMT